MRGTKSAMVRGARRVGAPAPGVAPFPLARRRAAAWACAGRRVLVAVAVLAPSAAPAHAQAGRAQVEEGNRLYAEGRFQEAYEKYLEALSESPGSPLIRFNEGNALYRSQEYQRALDAYRAAIENGDPALAASGWYNLGNALYRDRDLEESLEAYKQALRLEPGNVDAKHNLERVLQEMQQQEQQQDQPSQQDESEQQRQQQDQQGQGDEQQEQDQENRQGQGSRDRDRPQDSEGQQDRPDQGEREQRQGDARPRPGEMSREEAERLLQAVQEDPDEVSRKPAEELPDRRPRKKW